MSSRIRAEGARAGVSCSKADRSASFAGGRRWRADSATIGFNTAWAFRKPTSPAGSAETQPFRDAGMQGRITFHLSPTLRLTARLYGADSFLKVLGEPVSLGSPSGLGTVDAIPLPPALVSAYQNGTPLSSINTGNATYIPAPDNPDSTLAARFLSAALILNGQPLARARLLGQLSAAFRWPPLWRWSRRHRLSARFEHAVTV